MMILITLMRSHYDNDYYDWTYDDKLIDVSLAKHWPQSFVKVEAFKICFTHINLSDFHWIFCVM